MEGESGYEGGSEKPLYSSSSSSSSSDISLSECMKKKPCAKCGSNANAHKIMTCFDCCVAREHTYCMRGYKEDYVPIIWKCDDCQTSSSVAKPDVGEDSNDTANSGTSRMDIQKYTRSDSCNQVSATNNPPSSPVASSPVFMDASPVKDQKKWDTHMLSDSESAK